MAFASQGSVGTAQAKTAGATLDLPLTAAVPAGRLLVVWAVWESSYFFGPDEQVNNHLWCTDSQANDYTTLAVWYPPGGATSLVAMFAASVRNALSTSDEVNLIMFDASRVPKAASGWQFSYDQTKRWALAVDKRAGVGQVAGDPSAISVATLDNREWLLLHILGSDGPDTDAYTWDADYTEIDGDGTTGGTVASNRHLRGGFRIATLTGDTVDVQSDTADRRYDQVLVELTEVDDDPYFPTLGVLDDFNRANEDPLGSPPWQSGGGQPHVAGAFLRVVSNECAKSTSGGGAGSQWYGSTLTCDDAEIWVYMPTIGLALAYLHCTGDGSSVTLDGYAVNVHPNQGASDPMDFFGVGDPTNGGDPSGSRLLRAYRDLTGLTAVGMQVRNPVQHLWARTGTVWQWLGAVYRHGTGVRSTGKHGLSVAGDAATRLDDYGAGCSVAPSVTRNRLPYLHVGP